MQNGSSKLYIGIGVGVLVLAGVYYFYQKGGIVAADANATSGVSSVDATGVGADVLTLLNQVKSLKIEPGFFTSQTFQSLVDFSVAIPPENVGRPNPFAPLPGYTAPQSQSASAAARTLQKR